MSEKTTLWPYQKLLAQNQIEEAALPGKIQTKIKKLNEETDEDKQEALEAKIFDDVDEFIEDKKRTEKEAAQKEKRQKVKNLDVSGAPTAANGKAATGKSPLKTIFGG